MTTGTIDVTIGLDVGKTAHHACAMLPTGEIIYDKPLPQDEEQLRTASPTSRPAAEVLRHWLAQRDQRFWNRVKVVSIDGFASYHTAAGEQLPTAKKIMDPGPDPLVVDAETSISLGK